MRHRRFAGPNAPFSQDLTAQHLAFDAQALALVIVQQDSPLAELLLQNLFLGAKVLDDRLLAPVDPAGKNHDQQLPGLQGE